MAYSAEQKYRMDRLLKAFSGYVAANQDIDIAYAEKTGYVRLIIAENADWVYFPIGSFDELLQMFFSDVFLTKWIVSHGMIPRLRISAAPMNTCAAF